MNKYQNIKTYLLEENKESIIMTYDELENIIKNELPKSAYSYPNNFFSNNLKYNKKSINWLSIGYTARLNEDKSIIFNKIDSLGISNKRKPTLNIDLAINSIKDFNLEIKSDKNDRYMSWAHCHEIFKQNRNDLSVNNIKLLSLHLAFYLASWGMLRNSFLLKKDYLVHYDVVNLLLNKKYTPLWDIKAKDIVVEDNLNLIKELVKKIENIYKEKKQYSNDKVSDILITKVLMGTLCCTPAYDQYYKKTVKKYNISAQAFSINSLKDVATYYNDNYDKFKEVHDLIEEELGIDYPDMKLIDMCMWQISYKEFLESKKDK